MLEHKWRASLKLYYCYSNYKNKVELLNYAYTVKGIQCHSNHSPQLFELKKKQQNQLTAFFTGTSGDAQQLLLLSITPHLNNPSNSSFTASLMPIGTEYGDCLMGGLSPGHWERRQFHSPSPELEIGKIQQLY